MKSVLSRHPCDAHYYPLNTGGPSVCWHENLGTQPSVHLIEGVQLIWGLLNMGFTVHQVPAGYAQEDVDVCI